MDASWKVGTCGYAIYLMIWMWRQRVFWQMSNRTPIGLVENTQMDSVVDQ